jgi:hypothetical protein
MLKTYRPSHPWDGDANTGRDTLAGLERRHDDKDALSNWRNPTRPGRELDGSKEAV